MAIQVHDHIHLGTNNPPTTEYRVVQGTLDHSQEVPVMTERGVTGLLHIHTLEDGGGIVRFDADRETVILRGTDAITDLDTLKALAGETVYYVPNYHDDAAMGTWSTSAYIIRCVLIIPRGGITNVDPMMSFWTVQIELADHDKVTS